MKFFHAKFQCAVIIETEVSPTTVIRTHYILYIQTNKHTNKHTHTNKQTYKNTHKQVNIQKHTYTCSAVIVVVGTLTTLTPPLAKPHINSALSGWQATQEGESPLTSNTNNQAEKQRQQLKELTNAQTSRAHLAAGIQLPYPDSAVPGTSGQVPTTRTETHADNGLRMRPHENLTPFVGGIQNTDSPLRKDNTACYY